jgi:biopolymer transport protein TolQ
MNVPFYFLAKAEVYLLFVWREATVEGKAIIILLVALSIVAWSVMISKALQMRRARKLNELFQAEFRAQKGALAIFDRRIDVDGCPLFTIYQQGGAELDGRLRSAEAGRRRNVSLKSMEHVKGTLERAVAQESLKLESGLIMLALAVSGSPFLGLLGTVWGVMSAFSSVALAGTPDLKALAPGVSAALATTVAGLLVAIPSMFGYNWLVHYLRVMTVEMDNFAQEFVARVEGEWLRDDEERAPEPAPEMN